MAKKNNDLDPIDILYGEVGFKTFELIHKFNSAGLLKEFVEALDLIANDKKINLGLIKMWAKQALERNRNPQISIQEPDTFEDYEHKAVMEGYAIEVGSENPHAWDLISLNDIDKVNEDVKKTKFFLKMYINKKGGTKRVAENGGMTVQSLSRFLKSESPIRPSTLEKIIKGLGIDKIYIHYPELDEEDSK